MIVDRDLLLTPLQATINVVESRVPAFSHALLEPGAGKLAITAAGPEVQLTVCADADGAADGQPFAVAAQKLYKIVRCLPDGAAVALEPASARLRIASNGSRFHLQLATVDFPKLAPPQDAIEAVLSQRELRRLLLQTMSAQAEKGDTRFWLIGTQLKLSAESIEAVAQDGHQLAWACSRLEQATSPAAVIVPSKAVIELCKLLSQEDEPVRLRIGYGQIAFSFARVELIARLIDWQRYPDHRIPPFSGASVSIVPSCSGR